MSASFAYSTAIARGSSPGPASSSAAMASPLGAKATTCARVFW
jgi:hypothetical protein